MLEVLNPVQRAPSKFTVDVGKWYVHTQHQICTYLAELEVVHGVFNNLYNGEEQEEKLTFAGRKAALNNISSWREIKL